MHTIGEYIDQELDRMTEPFAPLSDGFKVWLYLDNTRHECIGMIEVEGGQIRMRSEHIQNAILKLNPKTIGECMSLARAWCQNLVNWRVSQ